MVLKIKGGSDILGTGEGNILNSTDCEVLGSTLGPADVITLRLDEGTELGSSYCSFDGPNEDKLEGSLL